MKFSTIVAALAVSTALCVPAMGEEALKRYVYNEDGQYQLADEPAGQGTNRHSGFFQASGALMSVPEVDGGAGDGPHGLDGGAWALRGSHNSTVTDRLNVQLDGAFQTAETDVTTNTRLIGAAHLYYRNPHSFAAGAFIQGSKTTTSADISVEDFTTGLEAAAFVDNFTLLGQVGIGHASYDIGSNDHFVVKGGVRYYVTDNLRFEAEASFNQFDVSGADLDTTEAAVTANYRPSQKPVSVFGGYRYENVSLDVSGLSGSVDAHTLFAGARFHYGSATLKDEERNGALWSPVTGYFE